ncbi:MAG: HNH endonuclease signature motif containing protein [Gemmatimonadaceae bacterium]
MTHQPKRRSRSRRGSPKQVTPQHSSVSTSRQAYGETRRWLLEQHGATCAYCGVTSNPRNITLDHVTPRKGQTAYDRRDNLVLACKRCNTAKADKPFLLFILAQRVRANNFMRYGQHLSDGIRNIVRPLATELPPPAMRVTGTIRPRVKYGVEIENDSPYAAESPYRASA